MPRPPSTPMILLIISTAGGNPPSEAPSLFLFLGASLFLFLRHPVSPPFLAGYPRICANHHFDVLSSYLFFLPAAFFFFAIQFHPLSSHPPRLCPGDGLYIIRGAPEGLSHRRAWLRPPPIVRRCSASPRAHTRKSGDPPTPRNAAPSSGPARGRGGGGASCSENGVYGNDISPFCIGPHYGLCGFEVLLRPGHETIRTGQVRINRLHQAFGLELLKDHGLTRSEESSSPAEPPAGKGPPPPFVAGAPARQRPDN